MLSRIARLCPSRAIPFVRLEYALILLLTVVLWGNIFKHVLNFAIKDSTNSRKHVCIKASNFVFAVIIYLCALHLCFVAELVFADSAFLNELVELNPYRTVFIHNKKGQGADCQKLPVLSS